MILSRFFRVLRDILSYCSIGFLWVYGFQTAFAYEGIAPVRQHRWLGYWMIASAFATADRFRIARRDAVDKGQPA